MVTSIVWFDSFGLKPIVPYFFPRGYTAPSEQANTCSVLSGVAFVAISSVVVSSFAVSSVVISSFAVSSVVISSVAISSVVISSVVISSVVISSVAISSVVVF